MQHAGQTSPPSEPPAEASVTSSLGHYELLVPIARGGMAIVWAARLKSSKGFQKIFALKAMHASLCGDARFEEMFLAEAEFASRIEHPNVCAIRDLGEEQGSLYIAMDWVDGDTLGSLEDANPEGLPIPLAARLGADAAMGLHAAHELRGERRERLELVHCDVSPQNILITAEGVVKIVDFGLARATFAVGRPSLGDGLVGGKMSYMSPEQATGAAVDRRTDVFALGIVLYRLLTGKHPFEGDTPLERFQRIRDQAHRVTPPSTLRPDCPRALSDAVLRALEKDPDRRFQTMDEFSQTLEVAIPEIRTSDCRARLAALAHQAVGETARQRRAAIAQAIQVADGVSPLSQRAPAAVVDMDEVTEPRTPLSTASPLLLAPAPARRRWRAIGLAAAVALGVIAVPLFLARGPSETGTAASATTAPRSPAPPAAAPAAPLPEPSASASASAAVDANPPASRTKTVEPPPGASAANSSAPWMREPGF
jgi:serine/threonine-protein kinase